MINTLKSACQTDYIMPDNPFKVKCFYTCSRLLSL